LALRELVFCSISQRLRVKHTAFGNFKSQRFVRTLRHLVIDRGI